MLSSSSLSHSVASEGIYPPVLSLELRGVVSSRTFFLTSLCHERFCLLFLPIIDVCLGLSFARIFLFFLDILISVEIPALQFQFDFFLSFVCFVRVSLECMRLCSMCGTVSACWSVLFSAVSVRAHSFIHRNLKS